MEKNTKLVPTVGNFVKVTSNDSFKGAEGIVMDINSDFCPEEGPIAVYLGFGNRNINFGFPDDKWKGSDPNPENYKDCPRVRAFKLDELEVIKEFSLSYQAELLYPGFFQHSLQKPKFELEPGKFLCQLAYCKSDEPMATENTIMNCWGSIRLMYTCKACHNEYHGKCGDSFPHTKNPLQVAVSK